MLNGKTYMRKVAINLRYCIGTDHCHYEPNNHIKGHSRILHQGQNQMRLGIYCISRSTTDECKGELNNLKIAFRQNIQLTKKGLDSGPNILGLTDFPDRNAASMTRERFKNDQTTTPIYAKRHGKNMSNIRGLAPVNAQARNVNIHWGKQG